MLNGRDHHELVRRIVAESPRALTAREVAEATHVRVRATEIVLADLVDARQIETVCVATAKSDEVGYTVGVMVPKGQAR